MFHIRFSGFVFRTQDSWSEIMVQGVQLKQEQLPQYRHQNSPWIALDLVFLVILYKAASCIKRLVPQVLRMVVIHRFDCILKCFALFDPDPLGWICYCSNAGHFRENHGQREKPLSFFSMWSLRPLQSLKKALISFRLCQLTSFNMIATIPSGKKKSLMDLSSTKTGSILVYLCFSYSVPDCPGDDWLWKAGTLT